MRKIGWLRRIMGNSGVYRVATYAILIFWIGSVALFIFAYFYDGSTPLWYNWVIQIVFTIAIIYLARRADRWPAKRQRLLPLGLPVQLWTFAAIVAFTAVVWIWGNHLFLFVMAVAFAIHANTSRKWWRGYKRLRAYWEKYAAEANAADPPVNIKVRLINGRTVSVECAYDHTDKDGIRVWKVVTPLPAMPIGIEGTLPPRTTVKV